MVPDPLSLSDPGVGLLRRLQEEEGRSGRKEREGKSDVRLEGRKEGEGGGSGK